MLREKSRSEVKQRDQERWEKGKVRSKRDDDRSVRGAIPPPWRGSGRCSSAWRMLSDEGGGTVTAAANGIAKWPRETVFTKGRVGSGRVTFK